MGDQRLNALTFLPGFFFRLGIDVCLVELPFHGRRKPSGLPAGESILPSLDPFLTNESIRQALGDLQAVGAVLRNQGAPPIGVVGMSLGAYLASLWACLEDLAVAMYAVPLVDLSQPIWDVLRKSPHFNTWRAQGLSREVLASAFESHCPLTYPTLTDASKTLIIAGIGDKLVPAKDTRRLAQHLGGPSCVRLRGGHAGHLTRGRAFWEIGRFLAGRGYADRRDVSRLLMSRA
jgi:pimeloyl-ACP methyl ester carboxylesterase